MKVMSKRNIKQSLRIIGVVTLMGAAGLSAFLAFPLNAIGDPPPGPPVIDDEAMQARSMTIGGAEVLQTTRTVPTGLDRHSIQTMASPTAITWSALIRTTARARTAM